MKTFHRVNRPTRAHLSTTIAAAVLLTACQAAGSATPGASIAAPDSPSPAIASASSSASTPRPSPTPLPLAVPRPTDLPTDGTCESGHTCLGLLPAGTYHSEVFKPGFEFTMSGPGWENLFQEGGVFALLSTDDPGDAIFFFRQPRALKSDGTQDLSVDISVDALGPWLAANDAFTVSPATDASVGGLDGIQVDLAVAPGVEIRQSDCPVQVCVPMFRGRDPSSKPTWDWDWGFAGPERQRLYLLSTTDGVVAIFIDSLDGTTFDALTKAADAILATLKFDSKRKKKYLTMAAGDAASTPPPGESGAPLAGGVVEAPGAPPSWPVA